MVALQKCAESFPFSALIPLRGLFFLRTSAWRASSLCPRFGVSSVFSLQAKTEKQKFSVFRFPFSVFFVSLHQIRVDMKFKDGYKVRSMAGENVVIMQGTVGSDMTRIISLNDSSLLLWNELQDKEFEVADVANILVENYGIDLATAERDAKAWVEKLQECGLI